MKNKFIMSVLVFSVGLVVSGCATKEIKKETKQEPVQIITPSFHSKALAIHDYSKK